ncbi:hypothetical protein VSX63_22960, partial [Aurantimonas sp. C2-4-R8]|nr:hypothetical protein [Aurantimonas sp. C2-4-R8]
HYWIGTLYTLMLSAKVRRSQATYFTPPAVADATVDLAIEVGFDLGRDDVLDPASPLNEVQQTSGHPLVRRVPQSGAQLSGSKGSA